MNKRELWLDYLRAFACILVTLGHLFTGIQEALKMDSLLISFGVETVYHFHVYIFLFCSGYLLQKTFLQSTDNKLFLKNKLYRTVDFVIIYIVFSAITFAIKSLLSGDVNSPVEHTFWEVLLKYPINQMWYMYAISIITICTPMIKGNRSACVLLTVTVVFKVIMCIPACGAVMPAPLEYLLDKQIWYVLGMLWAYKKIVLNKWVTVSVSVVFVAVNAVTFALNMTNSFLNALLTFTGIVASAGVCYWITANKTKISLVWRYIAKYMLQIYLLHTIFAAGIRVVLSRLGIANFWMHAVVGIVFSFVGPIACGIIAERTKIINVVFYPTKTVKKLLKK